MLLYFKKVINFIKKAFLVFAVYFVVINLFLYFIIKDKPSQPMVDPIEKNREEIYKVINDPKLKNSKEGQIALAVYQSIMCGFIGEACSDNPADGDKNFNHSLFGYMANLIVLPYANPPASGIYWAYSGLQNAGFIPKSYAAEGIGFASLRPLMNLWKVFRDVSYMLLVLILIAIGFMVIFRRKINPQTIITVESSLPRIIISLLLITFSFPIAGFLIDLINILMLLGIAILGNKNNFFNIAEMQNRYMNANFKDISFYILPFSFLQSLLILSDSLIALIPSILNEILRAILGFIAAGLSIVYIDKPLMARLDTISEFGGNGAIPLIGQATTLVELLIKLGVLIIPFIALGLGYLSLSLVVFILISFTFLFLLFRIFFLLFSTYIKIFLLIIFSPLFLLFNAIPGKNAFGYWFKTLFVNLLTFPIVILIMVISYVITRTIPSYGTIWTPPLLTELNHQAFTIILGMGIFFMTPDLIKAVRELFGVKDLPASLGVGTFFGGVGAAVGGFEKGMGFATSLTHLPIIGKPALGLYKKLKGVLPPTQAELIGEAVADAIVKKTK